MYKKIMFYVLSRYRPKRKSLDQHTVTMVTSSEERNLCLQLLWLQKHTKALLNTVLTCKILTYTFAYLSEGAIPAHWHTCT